MAQGTAVTQTAPACTDSKARRISPAETKADLCKLPGIELHPTYTASLIWVRVSSSKGHGLDLEKVRDTTYSTSLRMFSNS